MSVVEGTFLFTVEKGRDAFIKNDASKNQTSTYCRGNS